MQAAATIAWGATLGVLVGALPAQRGAGAAPAPVEPVWQRLYDEPGPITVAPGLAHVFVAGPGETLEALAIADGATVWSRAATVRALVPTDPLLIVVEPNRVVVLDQATGAERRVITVRASAVARTDDRLAVASGRNLLYSTLDGRDRRTAELSAPISLVAAGPDGIVAVLDDDRLVRLDPTSWRMWEVSVPAGVRSATVAEGRIYVAAGTSLFAYRASSGRLDWQFRLHAAVAGTAVVDSRLVYVAVLDNTIVALHRTSGNRQWWQPLPARPADGPQLVGPNLFVPLTTGAIARVRTTGSAPVPVPPRPPGTDGGLEHLEASGVLTGDGGLFTLTIGEDTRWRLTLWPKAW